MPYGKKRTKKEIVELKEKIVILISQGISDRQIAKQLKLPESTYFRYLDNLSVDLKERNLQKVDRIVYGFVNRSTNRIKDLHKHYRDHNEARSLKIAQDIENDVKDFYIELGVVDKLPDEIHTTVTYKQPEWLKDKKEAGKK